jgi:L-alanine-DL-glutamate epimerase-like enolase superfamily enzyme
MGCTMEALTRFLSGLPDVAERHSLYFATFVTATAHGLFWSFMRIDWITHLKVKMRLKAPFGDVSGSKRYWEEDVIDPTFEVTPHGMIQVPAGPGLGYHVHRELIERWTTKKETWRAC